MAPDPGPLDGSEEAVLQGRVTRVLFRNEAALFTAMKVKPPGEVPVTVVGELLTVSIGDEFTFTGRWEEHPRWGLQFHVLQAVPRLPREPEAIAEYLAGGLFPGVGPRLARRVVERFGAETLEILFTAPTRLGEVRGIGPKTRARLAASIREHRHLHDLAFFLQAHGISLNLVRRLDEKFGNQALAIVTSDPFRLAELPGIGFLTADKVARKIGLPADSPARIRAAVAYVLKERCEIGGHSYLPSGELVRESLGFLNRDDVRPAITPEVVTGSVRELAATGSLVLRAGNAVYLRETFAAETGLAGRLRELARFPGTAGAGLEDVLKAAEAEAGITYAAEQREAIRTVLTYPVVVLTGGPGTGKSTVIRGVLTALRSLSPGDFVPLLAAPTGRAAKRLAQIVDDTNASTIHRLLEFSPETGAFLRNAAHALEGDLLVVDEASMMDLYLSHALFQAVPSEMRVLLVGDADQLPSIGVGNVFADLIRSGAVPVVRLSHVFRQVEMSRIVTNAHRVNQGLLPLLDKTADFEFVAIEDETEVAEYVRSSALVLRAAGLSIFEINVLTPMRKTETGVASLNRLLQEALNPPALRRREVALVEGRLRVGDKVMQIRNNYGKNVFNGDLGVITKIRFASDEPENDESDDDGEDRIIVDYGEARVAYSRAEWDQLALAYATTVHKSQGSEYSGVVLIPVVREHRVMLQRNLLYTAITRARDRVVLVGQLQAIRHAVTNVRGRLRYSRLAERITAS